MEQWRRIWRTGVAPVLSVAGLEALLRALEGDDPALIQGTMTNPPPIHCEGDWPVECACAVGFCGWRSRQLQTVAEVENYFADVCAEVDQRLGKAGACSSFVDWYDDAPRVRMRSKMLAEVRRELVRRASAIAGNQSSDETEVA